MAATLMEAVDTENADAYAALVKELGVERYCHQLCHWLCRLICWRFCRCVCPPPRPRPWFTHVGHVHIYGDIDPVTGLTNKAVFGHGGQATASSSASNCAASARPARPPRPASACATASSTSVEARGRPWSAASCAR
jgi:hypothetical protein